MNIQILININTRYHSDRFLAEVIRQTVIIVRSMFPDIKSGRMDSPVWVKIQPLYESEEEESFWRDGEQMVKEYLR